MAALAVGAANSTTVDKATLVRVLNTSGSSSVLYVQDSSYTGIGSVTLLNNTSELVEKKETLILSIAPRAHLELPKSDLLTKENETNYGRNRTG